MEQSKQSWMFFTSSRRGVSPTTEVRFVEDVDRIGIECFFKMFIQAIYGNIKLLRTGIVSFF